MKISQKPKKKKKCGKFRFLKAMRAGSWDRLFFSLALLLRNSNLAICVFGCFVLFLFCFVLMNLVAKRNIKGLRLYLIIPGLSAHQPTDHLHYLAEVNLKSVTEWIKLHLCSRFAVIFHAILTTRVKSIVKTRLRHEIKLNIQQSRCCSVKVKRVFQWF